MPCLGVWPPVELLKPKDVNLERTNDVRRKKNLVLRRLKRLSENPL